MTVSKSFFYTIFTLAKFLLHKLQASERMILKKMKPEMIRANKTPLDKKKNEVKPIFLLKFFHAFNWIFQDLGEMTLFAIKVGRQFFSPPFEHSELLKQAFYIGYKSFFLLATTGLIMGLVLTLQTQPVLVQFGAQALLPGMVAVSVLREIGPVVTGLICAGKISSAIAAEIGAMKVTEQIDAMEVSGTNPIGFVVASRVLASTLMIPLLVLFSDAFSLLGSFLGINISESINFQLSIKNAFDMVGFIDIIPSLIKSIVFGFFIGLIGAYRGYNVSTGTESIGKAVNTAVINASLSIFIIDLITVLVTNIILRL